MATLGQELQEFVSLEDIRRIQRQYLELQHAEAGRDLRHEIWRQEETQRTASSKMLFIEPFEELRSPGRWIKDQGKSKKRTGVRHSFDRNGRIIVVDLDPYPRYYRYLTGRLEEFAFAKNSGETLFVSHHFFVDNELSHSLMAHSSGNHLYVKDYVRDGERVLFVRTFDGFYNWTEAKNPLETPNDLRIAHEKYYEFQYDHLGIIQRITSLGRVEYDRSDKEISISSVAQGLEKLLVDAIQTQVTATKFELELWAIFITYLADNGHREVVPHLCFAPNQERMALRKKGSEAPWLPDEYPQSCNCALEDPRIGRMWDQWSRLCYHSENPPHLAQTELLRRVATKLNRVYWQSLIPCSDSFFVAPVDSEGTVMFEEDLKASVPRKILKMLGDKGYFDGYCDPKELLS